MCHTLVWLTNLRALLCFVFSTLVNPDFTPKNILHYTWNVVTFLLIICVGQSIILRTGSFFGGNTVPSTDIILPQIPCHINEYMTILALKLNKWATIKGNSILLIREWKEKFHDNLIIQRHTHNMTLNSYHLPEKLPPLCSKSDCQAGNSFILSMFSRDQTNKICPRETRQEWNWSHQ